MALRMRTGLCCGIAFARPFPAARRLAAVLNLPLTVPLPAQALTLRLDWTPGFSCPPNPCIAGSTLVSRSLGLFGVTSGGVDDSPLVPDPGPPDLSCGANGSGSAWFDAAEGVALFGARLTGARWRSCAMARGWA